MKECLFQNWQRLSFVFMAVSLMAAASPGVGYLPRIGPAPLRFIASHWPCTNRFVLPVPVPAAEPAPAVSQTDKVPPSPAASAPKSPPGVVPRTDSAPPQARAESSAPESVIPAQMFLKYFDKSTNNSAVPAAPLDFTPPKAAEPTGSKATYSIGP